MSVLEKEKINVSGNSQPTDELVWEVEANVDENGTPGRSRLLITRSRLEVVSEEGELVREYPLSSVKEARMLSAVGGRNACYRHRGGGCCSCPFYSGTEQTDELRNENDPSTHPRRGAPGSHLQRHAQTMSYLSGTAAGRKQSMPDLLG
ncbi:hypothetical protein [Paenibacillus sp. 32O-W]|uniref:hypothetical protein n=1 Tax=Paenibacillus sp. 32O-W TaxID=1695218 RepID=UPI0021B5D9DA|nr:hypothetical protein [Paenibacillus sp. 32O-W]